MTQPACRSWVEVSRSRIAGNFRAVRDLVGSAVEVCPVVKADAYRHGSVQVAEVLAAEGARWLAVSSVEEAVILREAGNRKVRILVMADFLPFERDALADYDLTPVLHSLEDIAELDALAKRRGLDIGYHLKIDSGMGRLGTRASATAIAEAAGAARRARLEGLMTHFASAADYAGGQTDSQCAAFEAILAALPFRPSYVHMASTIAVAYGRRESWKNMVRPGHAIYGYVSPVRVEPGADPPRNLLLAVRPALAWKAALLAVKDVPEGAAIGYGAMFRAPRPMRIGVIAAGYADGVPHRLSNRGRFIAAGQWAPVLGAVSMDVTTIDLSAAPHLKPGDPVTLIGADGSLRQDAHELARAAGTISYSLLCGISARVHRLYTD